MTAHFGRRLRLRKGAATTAVAAAAVAALSASQAPAVTGGHRTLATGQATPDGTTDHSATGDSPYYTDLPPLSSPSRARAPASRRP